MKLAIVIAALLGVFLVPIFANDNVNENNQGNDGGNSHQTVSINNDKHVANIDSNNGWNSWNSIWDYGNGYIATRILSKKACIIAKMNKNVMPDVVELPQLIKEKEKAGSRGPPPVELQFTVSKDRVSDLAPYGKSVEATCRGIPTYVAHEAHGGIIAFVFSSANHGLIVDEKEIGLFILMKIVIAGLLGVLLTPSLATDNVNENNQGNDGGNSHQTVSINNDKHVANIDTNNGWNSCNSVWDYGNGFMATRVFSKKSCIIAKMNKNVMPDIAVIPKLISERKILLLVLLGIFMNPVFASNNIQLINQGNDGGTVYQTVNINHDVNVATFNIYSGAHSSNAIFDYDHGIIAYHMPYKKICVVSRMNRATFPTLNQLEDMVNNQRDLNSLHRSYGISRNYVRNVAGLGAPIQATCGGLSTYWATEYDRPQNLLSGTGCVGVKLLILDVNLCGGLKLF
ncbi:EGF-like module-containing mucin-like hormone receptor-like 3 [Platysternon megacephalum]|uniref:Gastrokine-1 n=1 Tax=Platysternon megacephalum TaxID=55544 RepID=A0A4D9DXQ5_9SAUR|nr:EGF-like module-containing mucin-like hormone receptor-like 3 [Platysternon megacephalum]